MAILTAQVEKRDAPGSHNFARCFSSHPPSALIEFVAVDNRLDVSARCGEIDLLQKLPFRYLGFAVSTAPAARTSGTGVVFRQSKRSWVGLMIPVFHGAMQIPGACLQICLWFEKLIRIETGDLIFARPLVGRYFAHLHQAALSMRATLFWLAQALPPA